MPPRAKKTTKPKLTIEQKKSMCAFKAPVRLSSGDAVPFYMLQPNTDRKIRRCIKSVGTRDQVVKGQRSFTGRGGKMYSTDHKNSNGIILNNAWEQIGLSKNDIFEHEGKLKSKRQSKKAWAQVSGEETTPTKKVAKKTAAKKTAAKQVTAKNSPVKKVAAKKTAAKKVAAKKTTTVAQKVKECKEQGKVYSRATKRCREKRRPGRKPAAKTPSSTPPSNGEIQKVVGEMIKAGNLNKMTTKTIWESLKSRYGNSVKPKKNFVKETIKKAIVGNSAVTKKKVRKPAMVKRQVRFQQIGSNGTVYNI